MGGALLNTLNLKFSNLVLICFSHRLMKTPAWSQRPSRAELTALTQPTCQPRDSSSRWHLACSGVLFTMQHSVQHKKLGAKERERARVWEIRYTLCLALGIHGCIISERKVWISFGIPGEPAQMKFEMASGCEWEWMATCCKKANIYIEQLRDMAT